MRKVMAGSNIFSVPLSLEMKWSACCSFLSSFSAGVFCQTVFTSPVSSSLLVGKLGGREGGRDGHSDWRSRFREGGSGL